jgi:hypothetical protein
MKWAFTISEINWYRGAAILWCQYHTRFEKQAFNHWTYLLILSRRRFDFSLRAIDKYG